jgi:hypothetical protein
VASAYSRIYASIFPNVPGSSKILKITPSAQVTTFATGFTTILGLAFDKQLRLYVLETRLAAILSQRHKASEGILALQPETYRYKHELDPEGIPQFGLKIAAASLVSIEVHSWDETFGCGAAALGVRQIGSDFVGWLCVY